MSALDNLSVTANVLQVIGFADTVFRAGKNLYELFDKARSASRNIALLLLELQALLSIVAFVHVVINEHASSPFAQDDGHMLPNVHTILTLIEQDFRHLRGLLGQVAGSTSEGWLSLFGSFRWALKDHEIAASRYRLAHYTQNLTAALSVSGRRNDIVLRTKLQSIEDRLHAISQSNPSRPLDPEVEVRPSSSRSTFRVARRQSRATFTPIQTRSNHQSSLVKADVTPTRLDSRKDSVITPDTVDFDCSGPPFINCFHPKINIYEEADQMVFFDTGNYTLRQITKPALLLRDSLFRSFQAMHINHVVSISKAQLEHLQVLFELFLASAHTESAEAIIEKYGDTSRAKLLDRGLPAKKCEDTQRRDIQSSTIAKRSLPTYLQVTDMTLDTNVGSVKGTVCSARSCIDSTTLAFTFEYLGDKSLGLSPFTVQFMAHEVTSYLPLQPPIDYSSMYFTNTSFSSENPLYYCEYSCACHQMIYYAKVRHNFRPGRWLEVQFLLVPKHCSTGSRAQDVEKFSLLRSSVAKAASTEHKRAAAKLFLTEAFESVLDDYTNASNDEGKVDNLSDSSVSFAYGSVTGTELFTDSNSSVIFRSSSCTKSSLAVALATLFTPLI